MSQVALIDLSNQRIEVSPIPTELERKFLGGRGMNIHYLFKHLRKGTEALNPDNPLIFGAGFLTGHLGICTSRVHVTAKSPETGVVGDSNMGGDFGPELRYAGFRHLVIKGKSHRPTYLWVHDGQIEFRDASHLWGLDTHETQREILHEISDPDVKIACIGPAGEKLVRFSAVMSETKRAAGRTGMGCVMGSKLLKAVVVRGKQSLKVAHPQKTLEVVKKQLRQIISAKFYPTLAKYGTLFAFLPSNEGGLLGAYNHQCNYFVVEEGKLEAETFDELYKTRDAACFSCPIHCSNYHKMRNGPNSGLSSEGPEWYFMGAFGPMCGNDDWETILVAHDLCNRYGMDGGTVSANIAWLMELYQRGIIDHEDTGGLNLAWGNREAIITLVHQMGRNEGLGGRLQNGWRVLANEIGRDAEKYMPHTRDLPMECIDDRGLRACTIGESTSHRGHDHLRGRIVFENFRLPETFLEKHYGRKVSSDPESWEGKAWMAAEMQDLLTITDCLGICKFATEFFAPRVWLGLREFSEFVEAISGWAPSPKDLSEIANRVWTLERMFNNQESSARREADMPPRIYGEPYKAGTKSSCLIPGRTVQGPIRRGRRV